MYAPKKYGTLRFCVEYTRINTIMFRDVYPILKMNKSIDNRFDAKVFSNLDAKSVYQQILIILKNWDETK